MSLHISVKATQGKITLENSHPFLRELWGGIGFSRIMAIYMILTHNSVVVLNLWGNTDSERAFCYLLDQMVQTFGYTEPCIEKVFSLLERIAPQIAEFGTFNFCLSNGKALFSYATTKLHWLVREYPFQHAHLIDLDVEVDLVR